LHNLASLQYDRGHTEQALATEREALAIYRQVYPQGHKRLAFSLNVVGTWLTLAGKYDEADRDIRDALAMRRRLLDANHTDVASSLVALAILDNAQGKYAEAFESARSATDIYTAALSASSWRTAIAASTEGAALTGLGRYAEAEAMLTQSNATLSKKGGAPPVYRSLAQRYLETLHRREREQHAANAAAPAPIGVGSQASFADAAHQKTAAR